MNTIILRLERKKRKWTQEYVAAKVAETKQAVCNWEKCRSIPHRDILIKLENLFGLSHRELFAPASDDGPFSSTN